MQLSVLVKQSVSVLTALSHTADQSRGSLQRELMITPLCMIPIFNLGNHDLRVVRMTCFVGGNCFRAGVEGRTEHEKKKSFQGDTKHSGVAMNSFAICVSLR